MDDLSWPHHLLPPEAEWVQPGAPPVHRRESPDRQHPGVTAADIAEGAHHHVRGALQLLCLTDYTKNSFILYIDTRNELRLSLLFAMTFFGFFQNTIE